MYRQGGGDFTVLAASTVESVGLVELVELLGIEPTIRKRAA